jgi:hypothetical protein
MGKVAAARCRLTLAANRNWLPNPTRQTTETVDPSLSHPGAAGHRDASSTPVLAIEAQTFYWTSVAAILPGTCPTVVLAAQGGQWWLPADRPVRPFSGETGSRTLKRVQGGQRRAFRAVPTRTWQR